MKTCSTCNQTKDDTEFYSKFKRCKLCVSKWRSEYRRRPEIRAKRAIESKLRYQQNREILCKKDWWRHADPVVRFRKAQYAARSVKREWNLDLEQFITITSKPCTYCREFSDERSFTGVDRVDNKVGYILGNCIPACDMCNRMKHIHTQESFLNKIRQIAEVLNHGQRR